MPHKIALKCYTGDILFLPPVLAETLRGYSSTGINSQADRIFNFILIIDLLLTKYSLYLTTNLLTNSPRLTYIKRGVF